MMLLGISGAIEALAQTPADENAVTQQASPLQFECTTYDDVLATVVRPATGEATPLIFWNAPEIDTSELSARTLCEQATEQFQTYHNDQLLNYVTTGRVERRPVACIASELSGGCLDTLFPLTPGEPGVPEDRPPLQLTRILRIRAPIERLIEETGCRIYVEFTPYLNGNVQNELCPNLEAL